MQIRSKNAAHEEVNLDGSTQVTGIRNDVWWKIIHLIDAILNSLIVIRSTTVKRFVDCRDNLTKDLSSFAVVMLKRLTRCLILFRGFESLLYAVDKFSN